jgi:HEAT repeats
MAKAPKLEATIAELNAIRADPSSEMGLATLRQTLASKHAIAVAQAAKLIGEAEIYPLIADLVANFDRLMVNPATTDQSCLGKTAIANALYHLEFSGETLFLTGIHHSQLEAAWGRPVDTAPGLRAVCALGLVRMNYGDVMAELADLLADPEVEARIGAVRAIAYRNHPDGIPLLRLKMKLGDANVQVLSECFLALLQLAPEASLSLVASFLAHPDAAIGEMAALALGESRVAAAWPILQKFWAQTRNPELKQTALLAIAMLRHDAPLAFLLELVATGAIPEAKAAIAALRIYQQDPDLWQRLRQTIEMRGEPGLSL